MILFVYEIWCKWLSIILDKDQSNFLEIFNFKGAEIFKN